MLLAVAQSRSLPGVHLNHESHDESSDESHDESLDETSDESHDGSCDESRVIQSMLLLHNLGPLATSFTPMSASDWLGR